MPLAENALPNVNVWNSMFTVSDNGTLAYKRGPSSSGESDLFWFDRSGKQLRESGTAGRFSEISLSPDGKKLAMGMEGTGGSDIWVLDLDRNVETRLTFSGDNYNPALSPDANEWCPGWSMDGRYLVFSRAANTQASQVEIWALPTFGDRKPFPVVRLDRFSVIANALSPDGKWLAYESAESGKPELYVQSFLSGGRRWQVSSDNSNSPRWRRDSKELFYFSLGNQLVMGAQVAAQGSSLIVGKVVPLFKTNASAGSAFTGAYDVSADGKQFVVPSLPAEQASQPVTLITNWPALLKKP
jgi:Tol biopolymer transport system component